MKNMKNHPVLFTFVSRRLFDSLSFDIYRSFALSLSGTETCLNSKEKKHQSERANTKYAEAIIESTTEF